MYDYLYEIQLTIYSTKNRVTKYSAIEIMIGKVARRLVANDKRMSLLMRRINLLIMMMIHVRTKRNV